MEALGPKGMVKYNLISQERVGTGGVRVQYKPGTPEGTELTAENATLSNKTGNVVATGNVIIRREGTVWKAERIVYNFRTKHVASAQFKTGGLAYFLKGASMDGNQTKGMYRAKDILFTTDDVENPSMFIKAKEVTVVP